MSMLWFGPHPTTCKDAGMTTVVISFRIQLLHCQHSLLFTPDEWKLIARRGKIHLGFLSLIKILLDGCSHMWPNYFFWAKRPSICSHTQIHVGMWDNKKCVHVGGRMHTPLRTAHLHVCMTNARLDIHVGANKALTVLQLLSSVHPNSRQRARFLFYYKGTPAVYERK